MPHVSGSGQLASLHVEFVPQCGGMENQMKETQSAGIKEFIIALLWAGVLFFLGGSVSYAIPVYKVIGGVGTLLLFCAFAFFVLTRYSAVFTYSLEKNVLRVNRKIGHRNKEVEIRAEEIVSISDKNPKLRPTYRMKKRVLRSRYDCYIVYVHNGTEACLLFNPSNEMIKRIKKEVKKAEKSQNQ